MKKSLKITRGWKITGLLALFFLMVITAIQVLHPGGWFPPRKISKPYVVTNIDHEKHIASAVLPHSDSANKNRVAITNYYELDCKLSVGGTVFIEIARYDWVIDDWKALVWKCKYYDDSMAKR